MSTSAAVIIRAALGKLGIVAPGQALNGDEAADCLAALNRVLDAWRLERLYAYATTDVTHTTAGVTDSLTIGPGGDINTTRPERFEAGAYYRLSGVDYPLIGVTEAEFNAVPVKAVTAVGPTWFEYSPNSPLGVLRFYPRLTAGAALRMPVQVQLTAFADLTTEYTLPAGYERALMFTLAEEIAADYEREIPPTVARNAAASRRLLKRSNLVVPQLKVCEEGMAGDRAYLFGGV